MDFCVFPIKGERMGHSVPGSVGQIPLKKAGGPDLGHMSFPEAITTVNGGGAI